MIRRRTSEGECRTGNARDSRPGDVELPARKATLCRFCPLSATYWGRHWLRTGAALADETEADASRKRDGREAEGEPPPDELLGSRPLGSIDSQLSNSVPNLPPRISLPFSENFRKSP
ncbi:Hypothetical protein NTJ_02955 [Nesidiocoris tenuis]|uniref:Uncharacterized protein n=1 Tax=Nesidiocoris tenuis TaxID=355587 RepID=A0ABN7ACW8_9HEMI|nr:Hypothetical protein NTJ_02955 [Nesidiocoris tenuis]